MKSLALSLLLVVVFSSGAAWAQAGEGKNDLERAGLAGRVKSVEEGREAGFAQLDAGGLVKSTEIRWYDKNVPVRTLSGTPSVESVRDDRGNWTRKTYFIKPEGADAPEPYRAEFREISYY